MPKQEGAVAADAIAKAWAILEDIEREPGPKCERVDVEDLLRATGFEPREYNWGWYWKREDHGLLFPTYKGTNNASTADAKRLVLWVREFDLLPEKPVAKKEK